MGEPLDDLMDRTTPRKCDRCDDDGWIEVWVEGPDGHDYPIAGDCPLLGEPWHRPFNASGLLPAEHRGEPSP